MSRTVPEVIKIAVAELWSSGWHPRGRMLTPEQQLGTLRDELGYQFKTRGLPVEDLRIEEAHHDGQEHGLRVACRCRGVYFIESFPPSPRSAYTQQAETDGTMQSGSEVVL